MIDTRARLLEIAAAAAVAIRPPERLTVSECADRYRWLSPEASIAQKWKTWPFQREPQDAMGSDDPCDQAVVMGPSQVLKTECIMNAIMRAVICDPGPIAVFETKESDAETLSKDRIAPMIRDCPELRSRVSDAKSRDSANTILQKSYRGGVLYILGAGSASNLAMRPIRYLFRDETDRWNLNVGDEGSPFALSERRTMRFWNRKIVDTSSPTTHDGFIAGRFELSDQRRWNVPCPGCGAYQKFEWANVRWGDGPDGRPWELIGGGLIERVRYDDAHYLCAGCGKLIPHRAKGAMNEAGRYIAENPDSKIKGFHCNALCYPIRSWGHYAEEFLQKKAHRTELQSFVNTVLAEPWAETGAKPEWQILRGKTQPYRLCDTPESVLPEGVLILTAGVDVQRGTGGRGWVTYDVWGWGRGQRSWLVDSRRIDGSITEAQVQAELAAGLFDAHYNHPSGVKIKITRSAIDSGEETTVVYEWANRQDHQRLLVVKGRAVGVAILGTPIDTALRSDGRKSKIDVPVWHVNVSMAKWEFYRWLQQDPTESGDYPDGYVFLPDNVSDEWLIEATAEEWRAARDKRTGQEKSHWHLPGGVRNEALDKRNYARAAACHVRIQSFQEQDWLAWEALYPSSPGGPGPAPSAFVPGYRGRQNSGRRIVGRFGQ